MGERAEMDEAMASVLASEQVALERIRRRGWQARIDRASQFKFEPLPRTPDDII
jgi:hypothetical protein